MELDEIRRERELTSHESLLGSTLSLAELLAKVTYNASAPVDQFDEDSGWWIAVSLKAFAENRWSDEEFEQRAWETLTLQEAL